MKRQYIIWVLNVPALVPATPAAVPAVTMQYGFFWPASAATSGYPRPVLFHHAALGKLLPELVLNAATAADCQLGIANVSLKPPPPSAHVVSLPTTFFVSKSVPSSRIFKNKIHEGGTGESNCEQEYSHRIKCQRLKLK